MPPSDGPRAVEWMAITARSPVGSSATKTTCSWPASAISSVTEPVISHPTVLSPEPARRRHRASGGVSGRLGAAPRQRGKEPEPGQDRQPVAEQPPPEDGGGGGVDRRAGGDERPDHRRLHDPDSAGR